MNEYGLLFVGLRYKTSSQNIGEIKAQIEGILGCVFNEVPANHGLATIKFETKILGILTILESWQDAGETVFSLNGSSEVSYENEEIVRLQKYIIDLFAQNGMDGWYIKSSEDSERDFQNSGGEHTS